MYKLKSVYATISFERNKINLLVVERAKDDKIHCLYFNSVEHDYLDNNISFINFQNLVDKLRTLLRNADNFLGINIKRYIINISCLPIQTIQGRSPESLVFETLTEEHAHNYVNKLLLAKRNENQYTLRINPTGWYLDDKYSPNFPEGTQGKKISFDYVGVIAQRKVVDQFVDLVKQVGGKPLEITCNSLCLGVSVNGGGIDGAVVDIKTTSTIVNLYDKYGEIKALVTIPKGSK
jgi:cell division ATPase FtsA